MTRIQRIVALGAVALLGAIGVTGVMASGGVFSGSSDGPPAVGSSDDSTHDSDTEVVGDAIDCPVGEDASFKFEQDGSEFEVTGTLVSFDGSTVVVTGPDGDVTATIDANFEIKGDPQPGDAVKVEGSVLEDGSFVATEIKPACEDAQDVDEDDANEQEFAGDTIACPSGEDTQAKFEAEGDEFEVTGTLVSLDGATVVVTGPSGDVTAAVDAGTETEGDPQPGDPVKVEGAVLADGSFVAHEVESACDDEDDLDDEDEGDDVDDSGDDAEDNSGPGIQSDDDGDHSGPGNGDDDDSGPSTQDGDDEEGEDDD